MTREAQKPTTSPDVEIRNLRTYADDGDVGFVVFHDRRGRSLTITDAEWQELGCPAYVVTTVRVETFWESTQ